MFVLFLPPLFAVEPDKSVGDILRSAESFFLAMKNRDFRATWNSLTEASRRAIVEDMKKSLLNAGNPISSTEEVRRDFDTNGSLSQGYWTGFLKRFNPDLALTHSRWEMGPVEGDRAEIRMTYESSDRPAVVRLVRENGSWKVGLVETFWLRKSP
jgi:hypothetical protein